MRKLVTLRTVKELRPIEGADRIELAIIDGWQCVVRKEEFKIGDKALYFEIDSILPSEDSRFKFLEPRKFRIKTMKLKKVISQGLLLPLKDFPEVTAYAIGSEMVKDTLGVNLLEENLTDLLKVKKFEWPVPCPGGKQKGNFPEKFFPKTDQERIQNLIDQVQGRLAEEFEVTEKLDGTSCTFFRAVETDSSGLTTVRAGACSRNFEMQTDDDNIWAALWKELELEKKLEDKNLNIAIQGEIVGPGVQKNKYQLDNRMFFVYDIYDIARQVYYTPLERQELVIELGLNHVPIISGIRGSLELEGLLKLAEGRSRLNGVEREGLVFKAHNLSCSFKVISNIFLLKEE